MKMVNSTNAENISVFASLALLALLVPTGYIVQMLYFSDHILYIITKVFIEHIIVYFCPLHCSYHMWTEDSLYYPCMQTFSADLGSCACMWIHPSCVDSQLTNNK